MTVPARRFTQASPTHVDEEITFVLDGVGVITGEPWEETFRVVPVAPAGVLDDLAASVGVTDAGDRVWNQVSLLRFIRGVIVDEDVPRFQRLTHDKDRVVALQLLGDVMIWLSGELVGHPTTRPSASTGGRSPAAPTSTAV